MAISSSDVHETPAAVEQTGRRPTTGYSTAAEAQTWRLLVLVAVTAGIWIFFHFKTDRIFITPRNLSNLTVQSSITALVALGTTWVLIVRQIDLACGSLLSLAGVVVVKLQVSAGWSIPQAIAVTLGIGMAIGLVHSVVIVRLGVPSFIMTLAGLMYLSGLAFIISNGFVLSGTGQSFYKIANNSLSHSVTVSLGVVLIVLVACGFLLVAVRRRQEPGASAGNRSGLRPVTIIAAATVALIFGVFFWSYSSFNGLPYIVAALGVAAVVMWFVGQYLPFGRHLYAIGGNPEAARRAGISVGRITIIVFVVAGFLAALGGVLQASRLDAASPDVGNLIPLNAISAAVVGGTSLFGGRGSILGTLLGALILGSILNGLSLMNVNTYYQYITIGWILVGAVAVDAAAQRRVSRD
jgi:D-xylose transport system permease protein